MQTIYGNPVKIGGRKLVSRNKGPIENSSSQKQISKINTLNRSKSPLINQLNIKINPVQNSENLIDFYSKKFLKQDIKSSDFSNKDQDL
jgi:hypothetical protein